ncbi:hypothetical protein [Terriglobus albidus]|uniref:hypothetical protein n=1 Tax=Terriglobus albidus TaxID=1592106 RepID=UPI0021DFCCCC|nr:hypothetical protein [Terriglobus albidus]
MRSSFSHLPARKILGTPSWEPAYRRTPTFRDRHHVIVDAALAIAGMLVGLACAVMVTLGIWLVTETFGK